MVSEDAADDPAAVGAAACLAGATGEFPIELVAGLIPKTPIVPALNNDLLFHPRGVQVGRDPIGNILVSVLLGGPPTSKANSDGLSQGIDVRVGLRPAALSAGFAIDHHDGTFSVNKSPEAARVSSYGNCVLYNTGLSTDGPFELVGEATLFNMLIPDSEVGITTVAFSGGDPRPLAETTFVNLDTLALNELSSQ